MGEKRQSFTGKLKLFKLSFLCYTLFHRETNKEDINSTQEQLDLLSGKITLDPNVSNLDDDMPNNM